MPNMNDVTLKEHIERALSERDERYRERLRDLERQIAALERLIDSRLEAYQVAVKKSEDAYNERFASANEFRQSLKDLSSTFVSRAELARSFEAVDRRLNVIENWRSKVDGRILGYSAGAGAIVLIITIIIMVTGFGK